MEPKFQTSFIPKKPISVSTPGSNYSGSGEVVHETNLLSVVAAVVFIVSLATYGGLYAYKKVLLGKIDDTNKAIVEAKDAFQPKKIQELLDANAKITSTKGLLEKHVVVSKLLTLLQKVTIKRLRIITLEYKNQNNSPSIALRAEAQTYNGLAEQKDIFLNSGYVKSPSFFNFQLTDSGNINVDFTANIDPTLISYKKAIDSLTASSSPDQ